MVEVHPDKDCNQKLLPLAQRVEASLDPYQLHFLPSDAANDFVPLVLVAVDFLLKPESVYKVLAED